MAIPVPAESIPHEALSRLTVTHRYDAPCERVFDAFLDVAVAQRFLFATAKGEMITAEIDPRVGGQFTFTERRPDMGDVRHVGEYREIARPHRLAFTFGVPQFDPRQTDVTIGIDADGTGCRLTLIQDGVAPAYAEQSREGWSRILAGVLPAWHGVQAAGWL